MAELLLADNGRLTEPTKETRPIRDRIRAAREARKKMEPVWASNLAYARGQQWQVVDRISRQLRSIKDLDPQYANRELYTADVITEYRMTVLGEMGSEDDRPELLTTNDSATAEKYQEQVNRGLRYGWDSEFDADEALAEADRICVDLGTAAIRCYFDPLAGRLQEEAPFMDGQPMSADAAYQLTSNGEGPQLMPGVEMRQVPEGRICWEALSPLQMLVPPGVVHEKDFPWECIQRALPVSKIREMFPEFKDDIQEDRGIGSTLGEESKAGSGNLKDHGWLFSYYERPTGKQRQGRVFHFVGNDLKLVGMDNELPYEGPDGSYRSGITYFHWQRVTGRFFSRSLVETLKDGQRAINMIRTDQMEILKKGKPFIIADQNAPKKQTTVALEILRMDSTTRAPQVVQGVQPGPWLDQTIVSVREDLEHASGVKGPALGENPANVSTYSQLALIKEGDQVKRKPVARDRTLSIKQLVENSVYDMRQYWGQKKQIMLAGDEGHVEAEVFDATRIPDFFIVRVAKGASKPRSQAAELKKIEDVVHYSVTVGAPLPPSYYKAALDAGQLLDLPEDEGNAHAENAEMENHLLLQGEAIEPAYYDPVAVHIPIHRAAQIEAKSAGELGIWEAIEAHIQMHKEVADMNAQKAAAEQAEGQAQLDQQQAQQAQQEAHSGQVEAEADHARQLEMVQAQAAAKPQPTGGKKGG